MLRADEQETEEVQIEEKKGRWERARDLYRRRYG